MSNLRLKLDLVGLRQLKREPGVARFMEERGERVAAAGRASAPVESGEYRDQIRVMRDTHAISGAVVHVGSTADHAAVVEAKTGNMARALDAAGGS